MFAPLRALVVALAFAVAVSVAGCSFLEFGLEISTPTFSIKIAGGDGELLRDAPERPAPEPTKPPA
jgi:hypothetical protein